MSFNIVNIVLAIILLIVGLVAIFCLRPKFNRSVTDMKSMKTKTISELLEAFSQIQQNGSKDSYRECVELKGFAASDQTITTPGPQFTVNQRSVR